MKRLAKRRVYGKTSLRKRKDIGGLERHILRHVRMASAMMELSLEV